MEFIENHGRNAVQGRIFHQPSDQDALGEHLNAGSVGNAGIKTDAVPDRLSDRFAEKGCHAGGNLPGGQPPRFQHENPAPCRKVLQDSQG